MQKPKARSDDSSAERNETDAQIDALFDAVHAELSARGAEAFDTPMAIKAESFTAAEFIQKTREHFPLLFALLERSVEKMNDAGMGVRLIEIYDSAENWDYPAHVDLRIQSQFFPDDQLRLSVKPFKYHHNSHKNIEYDGGSILHYGDDTEKYARKHLDIPKYGISEKQAALLVTTLVTLAIHEYQERMKPAPEGTPQLEQGGDVAAPDFFRGRPGRDM